MAKRPSAKDFIKGTVTQGSTATGPIIYLPLLRALEHENYSLWGRVARTNHHYVHYNTTTVELESDVPDELQSLVPKLQDEVQEMVRDWNREIERDLQSELDYQQSDEVIADSLTANEMYFDEETGDQVDMTDFMDIGHLPKPIAQRVLADYADLFDRAPEAVFQALTRRKVMFDQRGNRVDTSHFKPVGKLEPKLKAKVLDKYRNWNVEDEFWAESTQDMWKERLAERGFDRCEIAYSLGGSQGDGASFTCDTIDGVTLLRYLLHRQEQRQQVKGVVSSLIE